MSISVDNVSFTYAPGTPLATQALKSICLRIEEGEFAALMGRTGSGKTTLLQLLAGLEEPSQGRILLDGESILPGTKGCERLRRMVGFVFQNPENDLFETTVERDVAFALRDTGLSRQTLRERVSEALGRVGLDAARVRDLSPLALSGGEKRRVAIAGVLVLQPRILLLDEPFAGLDFAASEAFASLLQELHEGGTTILMATHSADLAARLASRLLLFREGELVYDGGVREAFADMENMLALHLDVSQARRIAAGLCRQGVEIPQNLLTPEELKAVLLQRLAGAGEKRGGVSALC